MAKIRVKVSITIKRHPEAVWDYTQDYSRRMEWDKSVLKTIVLSENPRRIQIEGSGRLSTELLYKLDDRPRKTTLQMINTSSAFIEGGGGSWEYIPDGANTIWIQTNTLVLKDNFICRLIRPFVALGFRINTRRAMVLAKKKIEMQ